MPEDITMCADTECQNRNRCWRFIATPDPHWQSYFVGSPRDRCEECKHFWPVKNNSPNEERKDEDL